MNLQIHPITPDRIDAEAAKVVRRLSKFGHEAYLVGGCVRDLLLGRTPKDFDVSTSATPLEIKKLFRNCRIIGRRFRLAHIYFQGKIIETATFRAPPPPNEDPCQDQDQDLLILRDNIFGTAEEDARRRDFTINGLFYDLAGGRLIDYVGGMEDVRAGIIRTIGDPAVRFQEDPVRILRAIKFAARLGFDFEAQTEQAMVHHRGLITRCSMARVLEEIYRLLGSGAAAPTLRLLNRTGVLAVLFPELQAILPPPLHPEARAPVIPVHGRPDSPLPPADEDEARDALPEELAPEHLLAPEGALPATTATAAEMVVEEVLGDAPESRQQAQRWLWSHLSTLDQWVSAGRSETSSHSLLLGIITLPLACRVLTDNLPLHETARLLDLLVATLAERLLISRKDKERWYKLLQVQPRLAAAGRRSRLQSLSQRDFFAEALALLELHSQATGRQRDILTSWQQASKGASSSGAAASNRRRPRHRRGRRRAPAGERAELRDGR